MTAEEAIKKWLSKISADDPPVTNTSTGFDFFTQQQNDAKEQNWRNSTPPVDVQENQPPMAGLTTYPNAKKGTSIKPETKPKTPNPTNDVAKQYARSGYNPALAYIQSMKPTYDVDKQKRLKNLAIMSAISGLISSAANLSGAGKNTVTMPTPEAGNLNYVAGSLKEMQGTKEKLGEQYKQLQLNELTRVENQADQEKNMEYRWDKDMEQLGKQQQFQLDMLDKEIKIADDRRKKDLEDKKALMIEQFNNEKLLIGERSKYSQAEDVNRYTQMGTYQSKIIADKIEQKKQEVREKGGLALTDASGTPYPRILTESEFPNIYAKIVAKYPNEMFQLRFQSGADKVGDLMPIVISTYASDPEIRAMLDKLLLTPAKPDYSYINDSTLMNQLQQMGGLRNDSTTTIPTKPSIFNPVNKGK